MCPITCVSVTWRLRRSHAARAWARVGALRGERQCVLGVVPRALAGCGVCVSCGVTENANFRHRAQAHSAHQAQPSEAEARTDPDPERASRKNNNSHFFLCGVFVNTHVNRV